MGLFSVFEKIINIENINLGCKKTREEDCIKKLNAIFSIVAEYSLSTKLNEIMLPPNIVKDISNYNIPKGIVDFINEDIEKEIHNEHLLQTNNYKNIVSQIIHQYRNGIRLHEANFTKLRSFFKNNEEIDSIYSDISKSNETL